MLLKKMTINVLLAPAVSGKTDWAVKHARNLSSGLLESPRLIVPSKNQVYDCKKRLARLGGALGVEIITFEELAWQILELTGKYPGRLSESNQGFLLKDQLQNLELGYYSGIKSKPGFTQIILEIIKELKAGGIQPTQFIEAVGKTGSDPRLMEIAEIYQSYQDQLSELDLIDPIGVVKLAGEEVEAHPQICASWDTLIFDGFDDLSPVQLRLLNALSEAAQTIHFTLTGGEAEARDKLVHKRFLTLLEDLSISSSAEIQDLRDITKIHLDKGTLSKLRSVVFSPGGSKIINPGEEFSMTAVPDRESEVRTAFRWLRNLLMEQKIGLDEAAIIMRSQESYRSILGRIAWEYGLQIRIQGGFPLAENPLISSILALLRTGSMGDDALNWRDIIENWQTPYFSWKYLYTVVGKTFDPESHSQNGNLIKKLAYWGSVVRGYKQWEDLFSILIEPSLTTQEADSHKTPAGVSVAAARDIQDLLKAYAVLIFPPAEKQSVEDHVSWIEDLLGLTPEEDSNASYGLSCLDQILVGTPYLVQRDWNAIRVFLGILKEQVWSSKILDQEKMEFGEFLADLIGVVGRTSYQPLGIDQGAITCADVSDVRGLTYEAVAILGLGEGEFPATIKEDPFLRDMDRSALKEVSGLPLKLSTESSEAQYFYESLCRSKKYLLLTRPRIADNGAPWQPSPFWEEIKRRVKLVPRLESSRSKPAPEMAGSLSEYYEIIAGKYGFSSPEWESSSVKHAENSQIIFHSSQVIKSRTSGFDNLNSEFDGGLSRLKEDFQSRFSTSHVWSSSRLETYQSCPFHFFIASVLNIDKPDPPQEGLDSRQLGNIYHHIFEDLYRSCGENYTLEGLLEELPGVAQVVFDTAPSREGFRETAWWDQTREEILENVERSIIVLETLDPSYRFYRAEQKFGIGNQPELIIQVPNESGKSYRMRGFIDRVDKNESGELRIIDYKTSSSYGFNNLAVREGKKLQLPIYAQAAQLALGLGTVREGFYFHVRSAETSQLKLSSYRDKDNRGPQAAIERTVRNGWQAVQSIQKGDFRARPPESGCPDYCPATAFCWFYQPGQW